MVTGRQPTRVPAGREGLSPGLPATVQGCAGEFGRLLEKEQNNAGCGSSRK